MTQCCAIHAFREMAQLSGSAGDKTSEAAWNAQADELTKTFRVAFWREDHFAEYVHAWDRLRESARRVCRAAKTSGYWRERYHPQPDGTVTTAGAQKYCEYPAVLVRVVLGNREVF